MTVTALPPTGNSSKFHVLSRTGEFDIALSFTLRTKIWQLADAEEELLAAEALAEAIISRHDPTTPFKPLYILAEHNTRPSLEQTIDYIRKIGL